MSILGGVGIDIHGFIECRPWVGPADEPHETQWEAAVRLDCLNITRDYDAFGCLFGVMNFAGFRPVAADRGLPADASELVHREHQALDPPPQWTTWVSSAQIAAVDWDEPAEQADARLHEYHRDETGQWRYQRKSSWSRAAFAAQGLPVPPPGTPPRPWPDGSTWTDGDRQFRAERLIRRTAVPAHGAWQPVWDVMAILSRLHGPDNCRLVVWFDG